MNKKTVVAFIREHKSEIIVGTAVAIGTVALAAIGIKCGLPARFANWKQDQADGVKFMEEVCDCCVGCKQYYRLGVNELQSIINSGADVVNTALVSPAGEKMIVKNIIIFGNEIKP